MSHGRSVSSQFVTSLIYQPMELLTEYNVEIINNVTYNKLTKAEGLRPVFPDTKFKPSAFTEMMKMEGEIELLIVVTMYNEDRINFVDTMHGIIGNLKVFEGDGLDPNLIGCIIIVDGIKPFMQTYNKEDQKPFFSNFFNEHVIKERFQVENVIDGIKLDENQEIAHCFMTQTNFGLEGYPMLNTVFAVKQKNKRKLNTHLWFFGGFCEMIKPKFVQLLDVGTKPMPNSLCALYDVLKTNPNIAGVCGEIAPMDPELFNVVVSAQTVEYTFSHIFDKAMESSLGYIGVLPGAFSAYKYEALINGPLMDDYFKSMTMPEIMNAYNSNIFLAEDRVLSLALVSKPGNRYLLKFVDGAIAETDVPGKLFQLLSQRRRWINGSWFALIDTWRTFSRINHSDHTKWRKMWFAFQLLYFRISILFTWVMVGSFYLFNQLIFGTVFSGDSGSFMSMTDFLLSLYLAMILLVLMMGLGVKTARVEGTYRFISVCFGIYMLFSFGLTTYYTFTSTLTIYSWFLVACTMGSYVVGLLLTGNTKKVAKRSIQFLLMIPVYVNVFQIYAICNIHDCSWGNRPDNLTEEEKAKREEFEHYRTKWVIIWIVSNLVYVKLFQTFISLGYSLMALYVLYTMAIVLIMIRFCGCLFYYFENYFENKGGKRYIRVAPGEGNAMDKQLLTEIVSRVKGKALTQREFKNSIIGVIEKRAGGRRGTQFQKTLLEAVKRSELIENSDQESEENSESMEDDSYENYNSKGKSYKNTKKSIRSNRKSTVNEPHKKKKGKDGHSSDESKNVEGVINFEDSIQKELAWNNEPEIEESKEEESEISKYIDMLSLIISDISDSK